MQSGVGSVVKLTNNLWGPTRGSSSLAYLLHTQGQITDSKKMGFFTNATEFDEQPEGGFEGSGDGLGDGTNRKRDCDKARR